MGFSKTITPAFGGQLFLPGDKEHFLDWLVETEFTPTGIKDSRSNYRVWREGDGARVEAEDRLTATNIGLENIALLPGEEEGEGFHLHYQVLFPKWARFCWILCICVTIVPMFLMTALVLILPLFFESTQVFVDGTVLNPLYLIFFLPILFIGLALPLFLVAHHKPKVKEILEIVLKRAAEAAVQSRSGS